MDQDIYTQSGVKSRNTSFVDQIMYSSSPPKRVHLDNDHDSFSPPAKRLHSEPSPTFTNAPPLSNIHEVQHEVNRAQPSPRLSQQQGSSQRHGTTPISNSYRPQQRNINALLPQFTPGYLPLSSILDPPLRQEESLSSRRKRKQQQKPPTMPLSMRLLNDNRFSDLIKERCETTNVSSWNDRTPSCIATTRLPQRNRKNPQQQQFSTTLSPTPIRTSTSDHPFSETKSPVSSSQVEVDIHAAPYCEPVFEPHDLSLFDNRGLVDEASIDGRRDGSSSSSVGGGYSKKTVLSNSNNSDRFDDAIQHEMKLRFDRITTKIPWDNNTLQSVETVNVLTKRILPIPSIDITQYIAQHPEKQKHAGHITTVLVNKLKAQPKLNSLTVDVLNDLKSAFNNAHVLMPVPENEGSQLRQLVEKYEGLLCNVANQRVAEYVQTILLREVTARAFGEQQLVKGLIDTKQQQLKGQKIREKSGKNKKRLPDIKTPVYLKYRTFFENAAEALKN